MATLKGLPASARAKVFRLIESTLKADPTLRAVVDQWKAASAGQPADKARFAKAARVAIRLRAEFGQSDWYGFDAQRGPLDVVVSLEIEGADDDDPMNLWLAIVRALYPASDAARSAIQAALVAAGADTGEVMFLTPAQDPQSSPADGRWAATGRMQVMVIESLTGVSPR